MSDFISTSCERYIPYHRVLASSSTSADYYNLLKSNTRAIKECAFDESYSQFKSDIQNHFYAAAEFWRGTSYFKALPVDQQKREVSQIFDEVQKGFNKTDLVILSLVGLAVLAPVSGSLLLASEYAGSIFKKISCIEKMGWIGNGLGIGVPAVLAVGGAVWIAYRELNPPLDKKDLISFLDDILQRP